MCAVLQVQQLDAQLHEKEQEAMEVPLLHCQLSTLKQQLAALQQEAAQWADMRAQLQQQQKAGPGPGSYQEDTANAQKLLAALKAELAAKQGLRAELNGVREMLGLKESQLERVQERVRQLRVDNELLKEQLKQQGAGSSAWQLQQEQRQQQQLEHLERVQKQQQEQQQELEAALQQAREQVVAALAGEKEAQHQLAAAQAAAAEARESRGKLEEELVFLQDQFEKVTMELQAKEEQTQLLTNQVSLVAGVSRNMHSVGAAALLSELHHLAIAEDGWGQAIALHNRGTTCFNMPRTPAILCVAHAVSVYTLQHNPRLPR